MDKMNLRPVLLLILPVLLSVGCGLSNIISPKEVEPIPTRTPMPTFTATPAGAAFIQAEVPEEQPTQPPTDTPTPTPPPTDTPTPLPPTDTPTPEAPQVTIVQNMNVRTGPGTNYPIAGPGPAGETAEIIGRNADNSWVQVKYPLSDDGTGWVYADLVQIDGDLQNVDVVQVAPPPVAAAPPPTNTPEGPPPPTPVPEKQYQFTPTGWYASENAAIVHFKGRIRDEAGNLVNGFSVLADNGAFSVVSHPTGASRWYPEKGDGEWDIVMPNIWDAQGWWWLTVVRYNCDFNSGFDAQCKDFTRLSEDVKIEVRTPDESVINADWVCHWDCNTGLYVEGYRR